MKNILGTCRAVQTRYCGKNIVGEITENETYSDPPRRNRTTLDRIDCSVFHQPVDGVHQPRWPLLSHKKAAKAPVLRIREQRTRLPRDLKFLADLGRIIPTCRHEVAPTNLRSVPSLLAR